MSWSLGQKGTKEEVKKNLRLQAESPLGAYAGTPEADDIKAALDCMDRLIDAIALGEKNHEGAIVTGVTAHAYGSHSFSYGGGEQRKLLGGSFSVNVTAIVL